MRVWAWNARGCAACERHAGLVWLPGRKISEGAALRGFAGFQKADEFGEETHLKGRPSSRRFRLAFHSAQKWKTPLPQA